MLSIMILSLLLALCQAQLEIQKPGVNDQCARFCDTTYVSKPNSSDTCKQGCRLFSVIQLTNDRNADKNEQDFRTECVKSCKESYDNQELRSACLAGCQNQTVKTGSIQIEMDSRSPLFKKVPDLLGPAADIFQDMRQRMAQMLNFAKNRMSGNHANVDDNDGRLAVQEPAWSRIFQNMQDMMNVDKFFNSNEDTTASTIDDDDNEPVTIPRKILAALDDLADDKTVGNKDDSGEPVIVVNMAPVFKMIEPPEDLFNNNERQRPKSFGSDGLYGSVSTSDEDVVPREPSPPVIRIIDDDWMNCVAQRIRHLSILTKWMLCLAMMLSVTGMIWICLAILHKNPKQQRRLHYILPSTKGGVDNVYYTTPPYNAGDKAPMIITTTTTATANPECYETKTPLEMAPPAYDAATKGEEKKN